MNYLRERLNDLLDDYYINDILKELSKMYQEKHNDNIFMANRTDIYLKLANKLNECVDIMERGEK